MSKITLYLSGISGNSEVKKKQQRVQMILDSKCINYEAIDITEPGREKDKETMQQKAKVREVLGKHPLPPQIFNGDDYCGDYEDFEMANEVDELEQFLHLPVPSKITSHDGTDKVNGSREEVARNGAKTEVNGDVELTSIVPETGPLSDEPEEEEEEADEVVNESEEEPQTIEKDEIRDASPLAEPPETDETLPIGEEAEPEIEVSSGGDALPEINTEIPEEKDASGVARVENDEGMVPEFVGNVGVGLITGQKWGGDEVKDIESVQISVVSDIVLKSVEEGLKETVEEFREKSVDLVKSDAILEPIQKDLAIECIESEAETQKASTETSEKDVASDERAVHGEVIQPVLEASDRDGRVVKEATILVCEVGLEENIQPSSVTSPGGHEGNRVSGEAETKVTVTEESRPVLKHQKAVLEAEIKSVVETSDFSSKTLQETVDSDRSVVSGEDIPSTLETSDRVGEVIEAATIPVSVVELEENIQPSSVATSEGHIDNRISVSDKETHPALKHQIAVLEISDPSSETLQKVVDSDLSVHGEEISPTLVTSDRAGEVVKAAAIPVSVVELEENIQPSSVTPSEVHEDNRVSWEAETEGPVADQESRPVLKHQKAVLETEAQSKELTEVPREILSNSQKREPDSEAVSGPTEGKQEINPLVEVLKEEAQKLTKSEEALEYKPEELIPTASVEADKKAEVPETEKPCVASSSEKSKFEAINSETLESFSIISKKIETDFAATPRDTSQSEPDNQVPPSCSIEAKEIGKNQSESTLITEPKGLEEVDSSSNITVEAALSDTASISVKPTKPSPLQGHKTEPEQTVSSKTAPGDYGGVETVTPIIEKPIAVQSSKSLSEDALKSLDISKNENQHPLNILPKMETEPELTAIQEAANIQEETDVLKPLARRDTLKHIKRPSLPLNKPTHDDEAPSQTHGDGVSFADLLLENHLQGEVDKISFSPQLVSKIISDKNIPKEERGLALKSWNYKPTEIDFVKQVRNLLDDRDNEIICYRARQRSGGYGRMRDPHDHFVAEMNKLVKEYESDEDEIYEVVHPPPPPKIPTPPPMPPVNEFLQEVLRALNAPWHPKPKPEEPKTFVKQVKHLLTTEELTGDGQALYFTKERGPLDDDDMVHKVRIILDEKESSMGIKKHETQTLDHVPFLSDCLVLLNDEPVADYEEPEKLPQPKLEKIEKPVVTKPEPEKTWKEMKIAEIFVRDNVYPVIACVTSDKYKVFVSALGSQRVELTTDDLEAATITVVEDNGYKSDVAKIVVSPAKF